MRLTLLASMLILVLGFTATGCSKKADLKNEDNKTLYAVGNMFGQRLQTFELNDGEIDALLMGMKDALKNAKSAVDVNDQQRKIQELFQKKMSVRSEKEKKKGVDFLENFVKKEGAQKTASGIAYKVIKEGTGKTPKATDVVKVHYHGTLIDGTVFDSSVERGKEVEFPLDRVIKGWTESVQLLKEGGKIKVVIPSELGYGDVGAPPKIPGGATLVFEIELFEVKGPAPAAAAAPAPAPAKPVAKPGKKK